MRFDYARRLRRISRLRKKRRSADRWHPRPFRPVVFERLEDRTLLATISWINSAGGAWNVAGNWDGGVPGPNDDAVIDLPGTITITHSSGSDTIRSLTSQESLNLSGGTLKVTGTVQGAGSLTMAGGTLESATVQQLIKPTTSGGILSGMTLKGDPGQTQPVVLELNGYPVYVGVTGDLTLDNATISVRDYGRIDFNSATATLGGSGTVLFGDDNFYNSLRPTFNGGQLTIGAGITVKGAGGTIGYNSVWGGQTNVSVVNLGTIGPDRTGTFYLRGASWSRSSSWTELTPAASRSSG